MVKPCMDQLPDPIEQELPDFQPLWAVTRAMSKKAMVTENLYDIDFTNYVVGHSFKIENTKLLSHNLPGCQTHSKDSTSVSDHLIFSLDPLVEEDHNTKSRLQPSEEQHKDPEISPLFQTTIR